MRHYIPLQAANGAWHVAYGNHRGEFIAVMECASLEAAYLESKAMTLEDTKTAICENRCSDNGERGNRYLRKYA
jgi:hypothetical protein